MSGFYSNEDSRALDLTVRRQLSGLFENYVNVESAPAKNYIHPIVAYVINNIVAKYQMNIETAGSHNKHTQISDYSDADFWINSFQRIVSDAQRTEICMKIKKSLEERPENFYVEGPNYKPVATSFVVNNYSIDIIFSHGAWSSGSGRVVEPSLSVAPFSKRFDRQRAVKCLKILSRQFANEFPDIQGIRLERLVLFASIDVDRYYSDHIEYPSGLLLFRTVLYLFIFSIDATALVRQVAEGIPPPSRDDAWHLKVDVYQRWKDNAPYILASLHEIRKDTRRAIVGGQDVTRRFEAAMRSNSQTCGPRHFRQDEFNRIMFAFIYHSLATKSYTTVESGGYKAQNL
eukprot:gene6694-13569_t